MAKEILLAHGKFKISVDDKALTEGARKKISKLSDDIDTKLTGASNRAKKTLAGLGKAAAVGMAAAAAGAVVLAKDIAMAGERASTANARTEQIAKSMGLFGDRTGEVTGRLHKLAEATARQTGMDHNAIKLTQSKLMTFEGLAKTADTVGGSFDRATQAAVDMAAAGFGTAEQNAVQLGKALQDPIKGITALARNGVTFTDAEKKKIEVMVKSGKVHEAQDLILKSLEKQTGGTAKATADASARIKVSMDQAKEKAGLWLLPLWEKVAAWIVDKGIPYFERFGQAAKRTFERAKPRLEQFRQFIIDRVIPAIKDMGDRFTKFADWVKNNSGWLLPLVGAIATMTATWKAYLLVTKVITGLKVLWAAKTVILTGAQMALNGALRANPIGIIITLLAGIAAALVIAYKRSDTFKRIVDNAFRVVSNAAKDVGRWFMDLGRKAVELWTVYIQPAVNDIVGGFKRFLLPVIELVIRMIIAYYKAWWQALKTAWRTVGVPVFEAVKAGIKLVASRVQDRIEFMKRLWSILWTATKALWSKHGQPVFDKVVSATEKGKKAINSMADGFRNAFTRIKREATGPVNWLITRVINGGLIANFNKVAKLFGSSTISPLGTISAGYTPSPGVRSGRNVGGGLRAYWRGGVVSGPGTGTSDSILARLSNNEFVVRAAQATRYKTLLQAVNDGSIDRMQDDGDIASLLPKYATGGIVRTQAWMKAQAGKPYVWAASGPGGYDCSGFVSATINHLLGRHPYRRLFATGSIPGYFKPGRGLITIGVDKPGEKGRRIGHTAVNVGGLRGESRGGGAGVLIGGRARSVDSFNHQYTLASVGGKYIGGGGGMGFALPNPMDWIKSKLSGLGNSAWGNILTAGAKKMATMAATKLKSLLSFDSGGIANGIGWMHKNTLEPERILNPRQTVAFEKLVEQLTADGVGSGKWSGGGPITININGANDPDATAAAVMAALERAGR